MSHRLWLSMWKAITVIEFHVGFAEIFGEWADDESSIACSTGLINVQKVFFGFYSFFN